MYWQDELSAKDESTISIYKQWFMEFLEFVNKTPDELIVQRQQDLLNPDMKIQRRIESLFLAFIAQKKKDDYSIATQQVIFASIRSFFEIHYFPLRMRKGDYPKGDSDGVRRATKEAILKVLNDSRAKNKQAEKAMILFLKDCGLRISDARRLNFKDISKQLENGETFIQINIITKKTKLLAKTFVGPEAVEALKDYLEIRKKGTERVEPETITGDSPLFRTWENGKVKRIERTSFSSLITQKFNRAGEKRMSAHSLRKKLQTDLEKAGVNSNWIDQILGHALINSRDAYSLPTDEELKEAYVKAYQHIRVLTNDMTPPLGATRQTGPTREENYTVAEARNMEQVKALLAKGYKYEMEMDGVRLFVKK
jgi:integrase